MILMIKVLSTNNRNSKMKQQSKSFITEQGKLMFVFITGEGRPNKKGEHKYQASIILNHIEIQSLVEECIYMVADSKPEDYTLELPFIKKIEDNKHIPVSVSDVISNINCHYQVDARQRTTLKDGKQTIIPCVDKHGETIDLYSKRINNGSLGCIRIQLVSYIDDVNKKVNIYSYLDGVQVINGSFFEPSKSKIERKQFSVVPKTTELGQKIEEAQNNK